MNRPRVVEPAVAALARVTGIEIGQAYTVVTGALLALVLGVFGLPPVLDAAGRPASPARASTPVDAVSAPPTTAASPTSPVPVASPAEPDQSSDPTRTTVQFRQPSPPARGAASDPTTTVPATTPPRAPIPATPPGSTEVFATVPQPGAPEGVGVGPDGTVFVATNNALARGGVGPSEIVAFDRSGSLLGSWAVTGQPEERTNGLTGLVVDPAGRVLVADAATARVLRLDPSRSELSELAILPDVPPCVLPVDTDCESGAVDRAPEPRGLHLRADGTLLVADRAQGIVWHLGPDGPVAQLRIEDRLPGEGPFGVTEDDRGVIVSVTGLASTVPPGRAAVVAFDGDQPMVLDTYERDDGVAGVTIGRRGRVYVALAGADAVATIDREEDSRFYDGGTVEPGFDAPTGLALVEDHLLVTNQATTTNDPEHWVIHRVRVDDRPVPRT